MFKIPRPNSWPPMLDLVTVRETLLYMKEDMARAPDLAGVKKALEAAISEIDKAETSSRPARYGAMVSRFLPSRRSN